MSEPVSAYFVCGGRWHDFDFARVEILKLLGEHEDSDRGLRPGGGEPEEPVALEEQGAGALPIAQLGELMFEAAKKRVDFSG